MFTKKLTSDSLAIEGIFNRYVESVFPSKEKAKAILSAGRRLTFYLGIDPTGPDIHLGNATNLLLLKKIQSLGHRLILLIGDFTAQTGDPTDKTASRRTLTKEEVKRNMKTYLNQVEKVLPKSSFRIEYNSHWLDKLTFGKLRLIARQFTVQQMIARDMFQTRIAADKPITVEEFLYPLMQGYDSVAMEVDGEIGGTDQTFNMLVGRDLVGAILKKEKIVITTKLLEDPETGKKIMNKSEGRYIALSDPPGDMFGKAMAMPDQMILPLFNLATEVSNDQISKIQGRLINGENPKTVKLELACELVKLYHGEAAAEKARTEFTKVFSQKEDPEEILGYELKEKTDLAEIIVSAGLAESRSQAKRLIDQGAVDVNGQRITDWDYQVKTGDILKVGPRRFLKLI